MKIGSKQSGEFWLAIAELIKHQTSNPPLDGFAGANRNIFSLASRWLGLIYLTSSTLRGGFQAVFQQNYRKAAGE